MPVAYALVCMVLIFVCLFALLKIANDDIEGDFVSHIETIRKETNQFRRGDFPSFCALARKYLPTLTPKSLYTDPNQITHFHYESVTSDTNIDQSTIKFNGVGFMFVTLEDYRQFRNWLMEMDQAQTERSRSLDIGTWR